ncbi:MAG: RecB family exonuclease [Oscillospiraceae bacterium]
MKNETVWSYSRVNCYDNCPRCFDLCYNQKVDKLNNAFAQWGSLVHKCLELYFKNELDLFSLTDYYCAHYDEFVTCAFPENYYADLNETYYNAGIEYLDNFPGVDTGKYEAIGVEREFTVEVNGRRMYGFIDLILKDKQDGQYIVVDHKSAGSLKGKKLKEYLVQLYLYSAFIREEYGVFPKKLVFNLFRAGEVVEEQFNEAAYNEAVEWFSAEAERANKDTDFADKISLAYAEKDKDISEFKRNDYFCNNICSARAYCERSAEYEGDDEDWLLISP